MWKYGDQWSLAIYYSPKQSELYLFFSNEKMEGKSINFLRYHWPCSFFNKWNFHWMCIHTVYTLLNRNGIFQLNQELLESEAVLCSMNILMNTLKILLFRNVYNRTFCQTWASSKCKNTLSLLKTSNKTVRCTLHIQPNRNSVEPI